MKMENVLIVPRWNIFSVLEPAITGYLLKLKKGTCNEWEKPNLKENSNHLLQTATI